MFLVKTGLLRVAVLLASVNNICAYGTIIRTYASSV